MTVGELMEVLERMPGDAEVRLAMQPSWPMQHDVRVAVLVEGGEGYELEEGFPETVEEEEVYLVDGGQVYEAPYLPGIARNEIGW